MVDRVGSDARPTSTRSTTTRGSRPSPRAACWPPPQIGASVACWVSSDHFEELGPAAAPCARRLRAAQRRRARQAPLLGAGCSRAARRRGGRRTVSPATAPTRWCRPGPGADPRRERRLAVAVWNGTLQQHDWALARDDLRRAVSIEVASPPARPVRRTAPSRRPGALAPGPARRRPRGAGLARRATSGRRSGTATSWPRCAASRSRSGTDGVATPAAGPADQRAEPGRARAARGRHDRRCALVARRRRLPGLPAQLRRLRR